MKQTSQGLRISIAPGDNGVISFRPAEKYWDISQWVFATLEIENKGDNEFRFDTYIFGESPKLKWGRKERFNWHIGWVKPGEKRTFNCVLFRHASTSDDYVHYDDFPGMKGIPDGVILLGWDGTDASRIKSIQLKFPPADHRREVLLHSIRGVRPAVPELYKKNPKDFFPFINEYGQYKHGTWPGKITSDEQFKAEIEKEEKDLAAHTGSKEWNRFGGYVNGPQLKATGHFRTEKLDGKWWIVDPDGCLFWSAGVNSSGKLTVLTPLEKRKHFFEKLPAKDSAFGDLYSKNRSTYNFGEANLFRKYGKADKEKYLEICLARLKSWGLNTMGGWSNDRVGEHPESIRIPYTSIINAISPEIGEKFPDVFDRCWESSVRERVSEKAAMVKNDPFFFGFFINNEITWDHPMGLAVKTLKKG
ncbi:MAG: hypothetical protein KAR47_08820, partial [Planctomycetes bacterium]|nr:hypothetical protein [Planctomycetota bacterium]